jgi:hypothetical protein
VDQSRDDFLSGAAFAGNEHRGIGRGDAPDHRQDSMHERMIADDK